MLRKWIGFLAACLAGMWLMASCALPGSTPATPQFTLTVTKPTGGKISSSVGGINCGTSAEVCTAKFDTGTKVTLTATADSGKELSGWGDGCVASGKVASCAVTMDADKTVSATFNTVAVQKFTLTVNNAGGGSVSSDPAGISCVASASGDTGGTVNKQTETANVCTADFDTGTKVTLTATADGGKVFSGWGNDCAASGKATSCEVTMDAPKTVTASFINSVMLRSAVQVMGTDGTAQNYSEFTVVNGKSLTAFYDILDSDGKQIPSAMKLSLCFAASDVSPVSLSDSGVTLVSITDISSESFPHRFKVSMTDTGTATLNAVAGSDCTASSLASQEVSGVALSPALSLGQNHSMMLLADGTVLAWGNNFSGHLGLGDSGSATERTLPQLIGTEYLKDVVQLSAGANHSMALLADGTVKAWGNNSSGVLGLGDMAPKQSSIPTAVLGLSDVVQLSAGDSYSMALLADGTVLAWGKNSSGELGLNDTDNRSRPTTVGLSDVVQLSAGSSHSMALLADGTVKAWGFNKFGQLGLGDTKDASSPTAVPGLSNTNVKVRQVVAGAHHSMAVLTDGTVLAWGDNSYGQLGLGPDDKYTQKNAPQTIQGLSGVRQVVAGQRHSMALLTDGTVKAWGDHGTGQLGLGDKPGQTSPTNLDGLSGVGQLSAGGYHSMALLADGTGTVKAWGFNLLGQLGLNDKDNRKSPEEVQFN